MNNCGRKSKYKFPFARQRPAKSFDSCASFMTAIFAVNFDWSIESCDKAPHDLNYERNTEKYGCAMKLAIAILCGSSALFVSVLVENPEDRFSRNCERAIHFQIKSLFCGFVQCF